MSSSTEYLDRLRNIREKYGCSQSKTNTSIPYPEHYSIADKSPIKPYQKSDLYAFDKFEKPRTPNPMSSLIAASPLPTKTIDYTTPRPQSSISITNSPSYTGLGDYSRRIEREKEFDQIRENYAISRRKVIEDFSTRSINHDYPKQIARPQYRQTRDYARDYSRQRNPELTKTIDTNVYKATRGLYLDQPLRGEENISPIKRMGDYDQKRIYRAKQFENNDTFWRERQAKLSQFTPNKLNQNKIMLKDDKLLDTRLGVTKRSGLYAAESMKGYGDVGKDMNRASIIDLQNKPNDYSVSNIDRIQQRIQSILGKR